MQKARPIFNITTRWTYNPACDFHRTGLKQAQRIKGKQDPTLS